MIFNVLTYLVGGKKKEKKQQQVTMFMGEAVKLSRV